MQELIGIQKRTAAQLEDLKSEIKKLERRQELKAGTNIDTELNPNFKPNPLTLTLTLTLQANAKITKSLKKLMSSGPDIARKEKKLS